MLDVRWLIQISCHALGSVLLVLKNFFPLKTYILLILTLRTKWKLLRNLGYIGFSRIMCATQTGKSHCERLLHYYCKHLMKINKNLHKQEKSVLKIVWKCVAVKMFVEQKTETVIACFWHNSIRNACKETSVLLVKNEVMGWGWGGVYSACLTSVKLWVPSPAPQNKTNEWTKKCSYQSFDPGCGPSMCLVVCCS